MKKYFLQTAELQCRTPGLDSMFLLSLESDVMHYALLCNREKRIAFFALVDRVQCAD
jgi:hypothetical protein